MIRHAASAVEDDELEGLLSALRDDPTDLVTLRKATSTLRREMRMREAHQLVSAFHDLGGGTGGLVDELDRIAGALGPALASADADADARTATLDALVHHTVEGRDPLLPGRERLAVARHLLDAGAFDDALAVLRPLRDEGEIGRIAKLLESRLRFDRLELDLAADLLADATPGPVRDDMLRRIDGLASLADGAGGAGGGGGGGGGGTGRDVVRRAVHGYVGTPRIAPANDPPRVVFTIGSLAAGGAEMQLARVAVLLRCCGIDVRVLHDDRMPASEAIVRLLAQAGVPTSRFADFTRPIADPGSGDVRTAHLRAVLGERETLHGLEAALRAWRPDVVHVIGDAATFLERTGLVARACGVPTIIIGARTLSPIDRQDLLAKPTYLRRTPLSQVMLSELTAMPGVHFAANSAAGLESFRRWLGGLPPTARELPNLVDVDRVVEEAGTPIDPPWPSDAIVIGGAFRLYAVKRPLLWLEVARRVASLCPTAHFAIAGDGPMAAEVAAAASGIANVHLLGHRSPAAPWLRSFTTFLLTSSAEGLPNACLEAQAVGVPVVSSDAGGAGQTFRDGVTGILVRDIDDPDAFARAIIATLDERWRATAVREAPRHVAERNGPEAQHETLLRLYGLHPADHPLDPEAWAACGTLR